MITPRVPLTVGWLPAAVTIGPVVRATTPPTALWPNSVSAEADVGVSARPATETTRAAARRLGNRRMVLLLRQDRDRLDTPGWGTETREPLWLAEKVLFRGSSQRGRAWAVTGRHERLEPAHEHRGLNRVL